jgi:hypothetical protein
MNLEAVGKLVTRHTALPEEVQARLDKTQRDREAVHRMFSWMTWGFIILGIGVVMLVANKNFDIGKMFKFISTLTVLGGVGVTMGGLLGGMKRGAELSGRSRPREVATNQTPKSLPTNPFPEQLPSVTERTTQLIGRSEQER